MVQSRLRHKNATYAHVWPESDTSTRELVGAAFADRDVDHGPGLRAV